jgi:hypothetical protein
VDTDVSLVKILPPPVNPVKISDKNHGPNVGAQMVTMTMVITPNVKSVTTNVSPVTTVLVVLSVKVTENKTHQCVHVQWEPMNVEPLVNVAHVTLTVPNVLDLPITVQFVLNTERTTHHPAHVKIGCMKSKELVTIVTQDVPPVVVIMKNHLMLVATVKTNLTECKMLHYVLVWITTMKLKTSNVKNVTKNVNFVKILQKTVLNVKDSESIHQLVVAHTDISKTLTSSVNLVLQNVYLVSLLPITVLNVLKIDMTIIQLVHVLMDTSKRTIIVKLVVADVLLVTETLKIV